MARRRSLTTQLRRTARASNNLRAASRGPAAYGKRVARRKVYGKEMRLTRRLMRGFGLSR
jgi:hypothetical protein